jgi:hypothetical protein
MFNDDLARAIIAAAQQHGIDHAAMLAIVEVETGGKTFENDGRTPQFLYERHIAWREAAAVSNRLLATFRRAGLAIPHWSRATQYKDERTSAMRMDLMKRACALDAEVAKKSASWGLGQTMGFLCHDLGFSSAVAMVEFMMGSIANQIECMVRELQHSKLIPSMNSHDWTRVARVYNGAGYAQNHYDTRLRDAYVRWSRKLPQLEKNEPPPPEQLLAQDQIEDIQTKLRDLGYHEVGVPDGHWGSKTTAAISAFQHHEGLTITGHYDNATEAAIEAAEIPRPVPMERAETTADDLRDAGSDTIAHTDKLLTASGVKKAGGIIAIGGGILDKALPANVNLDTVTDALDKVQQGKDKIDQAKGAWHQGLDLFHSIFGGMSPIVFGLILLAAGILVAGIARKIEANRVKDHNTGEHAGPTPAPADEEG